MTVREFFNNDFTVDGDVIIKHCNSETVNTYNVLGYRYYELEDDERDYEISYIYANADGLNIEVKYPDE